MSRRWGVEILTANLGTMGYDGDEYDCDDKWSAHCRRGDDGKICVDKNCNLMK